MNVDIGAIILDTGRRIFQKYSTPETITGAENGTFPSALWEHLEHNGFVSLDEEGLTYTDGLNLLKIAGYYAVPVPLADSILASKLLQEHGINVPEGLVTLGIQPASDVVVSQRATGGSISGCWRGVPWARTADAVVLFVPAAGGENWIAVVKNEDLRVEKHNSLSSEPLDTVYLENVVPYSSSVTSFTHREVLAHGAMTRVLLASGALQRILEMTIRYAGERSQFGRAISKFQAVQQQIAELAAETAAFCAIAERTFKAAASNQELCKYTALAKIRLAQAAQIATTNAHQVHGAMGFTREYTLHHYTRRVWSYRHEFGNERVWCEVLAAELDGQNLWAFITR